MRCVTFSVRSRSIQQLQHQNKTPEKTHLLHAQSPSPEFTRDLWLGKKESAPKPLASLFVSLGLLRMMINLSWETMEGDTPVTGGAAGKKLFLKVLIPCMYTYDSTTVLVD